jgi:hypothetical protein
MPSKTVHYIKSDKQASCALEYDTRSAHGTICAMFLPKVTPESDLTASLEEAERKIGTC